MCFLPRKIMPSWDVSGLQSLPLRTLWIANVKSDTWYIHPRCDIAIAYNYCCKLWDSGQVCTFIGSDDNKLQDEPMVDLLYTHIFPMHSSCTCVACQVYKYIHILSIFVNTHAPAINYKNKNVTRCRDSRSAKSIETR